MIRLGRDSAKDHIEQLEVEVFVRDNGAGQFGKEQSEEEGAEVVCFRCFPYVEEVGWVDFLSNRADWIISSFLLLLSLLFVSVIGI
jgi:hypothetical protein